MESNLFVRSVYSLLSSMCTIDEIISYAKKYGYSSIGLVDKNVLAGGMSFKKACDKNNIHPIFGIELTIHTDVGDFDVVLYAKNDNGYKNLMKLSSYVCSGHVLNLDYFNQYRQDTVLCLLSDSMPLTSYVDKNDDIEKGLNIQKELFHDYIVGLVDHTIKANYYRDQKIKEIAKKNKIFTFALNRTFYLNKEDNEDYEVLKCIRDKKTIDDKDIVYENGRYFLNKEEFKELYDEEDLNNSDILAKTLDVKMDFKTSLPLYKTNNGMESKDYLVALCKEGLRRRLKNEVSKTYRERLEYELKIILQMHFEDYFLIVYDFILFAKKNNIMVGPARGSAGGSLVSYCLGITDIDPLKYGLIFERFLNPERVSMPDIDTDFPDDRRDEVIQYVANKYGEEHVGHIITYGTLKAKQVIRDVGRVLNYPLRELDAISKAIPNILNIDLKTAYETSSLFKQKIESDERFRKLYRISRKFELFPRHESTHAAGIVMSLKPLSDVVPTIKIENDIVSTQYTMEHLEELGLIKMDFLGLRNLGIIAEIVADINTQKPFNIKTIPLDDQKTFDLIDNVNVSGVFQLESNGMRSLIRKMKPKTFEEIGMTIALFRPGPMENIPMFLENRQHSDKVFYLHPNLKPILKETYGVIVYQEQVMDIARVMAGFSYGKADILRKAMSKKKVKELENLYPDFINGCIQNGYDQKTAKDIYDLIMKFANYGFNKSHSIGYGMLAYQMAYLKANYPLFFYKALLNGVIGSQSKTYDYIFELQSINQNIKHISMNHSDATYKIENDSIIMPLSICKDVGSVSVLKILTEREENGFFKDYLDCVVRLVNRSIDKNVLESLIYAGAFDEFKLTRHTMIKALPNALMYANAHKGEISILDKDDEPIIENLKDDPIVLAENEKNVLGFYFTYNPIVELKKKYNIQTESLSTLSNNSYGKGFGLISRVKEIKTKKGDRMAFVDIVDDKGQMSLAIMPNVYSQFESELLKGYYVYFEGKFEKQDSCLVKNMKIIKE